MRLTCPNCAAQYEVPEDVIPAEGRDVQCSNCGQTWFQAAAGAAPAEDVPEDTGMAATAPQAAAAGPEPELEPQDSAQEPPRPEPAPAPQPDPEPEDAAAPVQDSTAALAGDQPDTRDEDEEEDGHEDTQDAEPPKRGRSLDPAMSDILREEAAREAELRAAESQSLETQPDLGLDGGAAHEDEAARRSRQARDRMARIRGEDPRQLAAAESGSRKELLPDIEEINSTLRSAGSAAPAPHPAPDDFPVRRKSGFARGFSLSVIAALVLVMVYDNAPLIAEKLPQADPALSSYVAWVDQARLWLDGQVKSVTATQ